MPYQKTDFVLKLENWTFYSVKYNSVSNNNILCTYILVYNRNKMWLLPSMSYYVLVNRKTKIFKNTKNCVSDKGAVCQYDVFTALGRGIWFRVKGRGADIF